MPYDGLVTRNICKELNILLLNGKIDKIIEPNRDDILLFIRNNRNTYKLLLSSNAENARTHITNVKSIENPIKPFNFCMVLRKYLLGAKLIEISQPNNDRIINFTFENSNELGDKEIKTLIIEMMGKHSNIILTTQNRIIVDSIHHVDFEMSRIREVMPGRNYILPLCQDKLNPFDVDENKFNNLIKDRCILSSTFIGLSSLIQKELSEISYTAFYNFITQDVKPVVSYKNGIPSDFYFIPLKNSFHETKEFETLSEAIDFFYTNKLEFQKLESKKHELINIISNLVSKTEKKIKVATEKIETTKEMEKLRIEGELLSANLYKVTPFSSSITVDNYYEGTTLTISLEPTLSASLNLQKKFKKYTKLKNTFIACSKQLAELNTDLTYYESLFYEIYTQESVYDLEEIKLELISQGILKQQNKKQKEIPSKPLEFTFNGYTILVGKNNIQNDKLTFHIAHKSDIWFHVKNAPGSHTILRINNQDVSHETLEYAASLAAYHSKQKNSSKVEVDYTFVKNVKKIPGAKPGMVTYENYKTLYVTPFITN